MFRHAITRARPRSTLWLMEWNTQTPNLLPLPLTLISPQSATFTTVPQTFTASPTHVLETMFELEEVQESYVLAQLQTLKTNKAIGLDKISARLLKCPSCSISKSVTRLLNLSIKSNHFQRFWNTLRSRPYLNQVNISILQTIVLSRSCLLYRNCIAT
jgi:hypothetical protein